MLCAFAFLFWNGGASVISKVVHQVNEEIRDKEIRLIGETGEQLGIMSSEEALDIAEAVSYTHLDVYKRQMMLTLAA